MSSRERTTDVAALRAQLAREAFDWGSAGRESHALTCEFLAFERPLASRDPFERPWQVAAPPAAASPTVLREALGALAARAGVRFEPDGAWSGARDVHAAIGPGGQACVHSGEQASPARAWAAARDGACALRAELAARGTALFGIGFDPWSTLEDRAAADDSPWGACLERSLKSANPAACEARRLGAATRVRIGFGGPNKGPRRWRAAWLVAPVLRAAFAHAPVSHGAAGRLRSARGRAQRFADPTRSGAGTVDPARLMQSPLDGWLELALGARVLWMLRDGRAYPVTAPLTFETWLSKGFDGTFPDLEDWRAHLLSLDTEVRPGGQLRLDGADAQALPFASLPLTLWSALLCDDAALSAVLARLEGSAGTWRERAECAWREGLLEPTLASDARALFAIAADALLRAPQGTFSAEMMAAFVSFERRFVRRGRTPADDVLDRCMERGGLDASDLVRLEAQWTLGAPRQDAA